MVNFKVVDNDTIDNKHYINHSQNENNYVVVNTENDNKYIEYLLLNLNIYNYIKEEYIENHLNDLNNLNEFDKAYLNDFDMHYVNGFLSVEYNENDIYNFFNKYEKFFIKDLKIDLIELYNNLVDEVEKLNDLNLLY